ncbi:hypothetical protein ACP70R_029243 [Stipagrostis hirtigluma subsp. patula]
MLPHLHRHPHRRLRLGRQPAAASGLWQGLCFRSRQAAAHTSSSDPVGPVPQIEAGGDAYISDLAASTSPPATINGRALSRPRPRVWWLRAAEQWRGVAASGRTAARACGILGWLGGKEERLGATRRPRVTRRHASVRAGRLLDGCGGHWPPAAMAFFFIWVVVSRGGCPKHPPIKIFHMQ